MGNTHQQQYFKYNKPEDPSNYFHEKYIGPFIHPSVGNFEKEIDEGYKNRTLIESILNNLIKHKERDCLGVRKMIKEGEFEKKYTFFKYGEVYDMCMNFAKNLHEKKSTLIYEDDYDGRHFNLIGIFAKNCVEWLITDLGCQMNSVTTVTLYATLGKEAFKYICNQTNITTICVSPDLVDTLIDCKSSLSIDTLKTAILFDFTTNVKQEHYTKLKDAGFEVLSFKDFLKKNVTLSDKDLTMSGPETVMTICYTSGTTGNPKGVIIVQRNMIAVLEKVIIDPAIPTEDGVHMSFLPLAHIMERMILSGFLTIAGKIGFLSGTVKTTLMEDVKLLKPTILTTVPRVLQTLRTKVFDQFEKLSGFKKALAFKALNTKRENYKKYGVITHSIYDKLVFSRIREGFGGNLKLFLCASAPMPKELADDIKILLSVPIVEGWGMTELSGSPFATHSSDLTNITAGGVISSAKLKFVDLPDLEYTRNFKIDGKVCPSGEICIKGPLVCVGYYKNEEENKKAFDEEGYLHTGDIGCIFPHYGNGVRIIDRVKEIFKLSQGEYIIPSKLEGVYLKCKYIAQILIYGNSSKNYIIGLINLNLKECGEFLGLTKEETTIDRLKHDEKLHEEIKKNFIELSQEAGFNGLERLTHFIITDEFTSENGCLTPSLKLVRKKIEKMYKDEIEDYYSNHSK